MLHFDSASAFLHNKHLILCNNRKIIFITNGNTVVCNIKKNKMFASYEYKNISLNELHKILSFNRYEWNGNAFSDINNLIIMLLIQHANSHAKSHDVICVSTTVYDAVRGEIPAKICIELNHRIYLFVQNEHCDFFSSFPIFKI